MIPMVQLHEELVVRVAVVRPWGIEISTGDGESGLVDNVKIPAWRDSGATPTVGEEVLVVVLDDARVPFRASAMPDDLEIGRRLRATGK
jgi:hypothetical protein